MMFEVTLKLHNLFPFGTSNFEGIAELGPVYQS